MVKTCVLCSAEFSTDQRLQMYCSCKCMYASRKGRPLPQFDGKRNRHRAKGESRAGWKGDGATANTKRHRARRYHPIREFCDRCLVAKAKDRHHIDGDPGNNDPSNIACLCRHCHMVVDGRLGQRKGKGKHQLAQPVNVKELAAQLEERG